MDALGELGEMDQVHEVKQITWTIPAFFSLPTEVGKGYCSQSFYFADEQLHFIIYPGGHNENTKDSVVVFPMKEEPFDVECHVKCDVGLKVADGSVKIAGRYMSTCDEGGKVTIYLRSSRRVELLRTFAPSDTLTFVLRLRHGDPLAMEPAVLRETFIDHAKLSTDFKDLLADKNSSDATLVVGGKEFHVHKCVLSARSPVFAAMFRHGMTEKETGTVDIPDCDEGTFGTFLEYLYSGRAENINFSSALELYRPAQKYGVLELAQFCAKVLGGHLAVDNLMSAAMLSDRYDEKGLATAVQDFFNGHHARIAESKEFMSLMEKDCRLAHKLFAGFSKYVSNKK